MQAHKVNLLRFWVLPVGLLLNGKIYLKPEYGSCKCLNQVGLVDVEYFETRLGWKLLSSRKGLHLPLPMFLSKVR